MIHWICALFRRWDFTDHVDKFVLKYVLARQPDKFSLLKFLCMVCKFGLDFMESHIVLLVAGYRVLDIWKTDCSEVVNSLHCSVQPGIVYVSRAGPAVVKLDIACSRSWSRVPRFYKGTPSTRTIMLTDKVNPYELLDISLESSEADIRRAYRQQSLKVHPDRVCLLNIHGITFI